MDRTQPTEGHRRLELLAGTWEGEEHMHPSDWDPAGGTATGRGEYRLALGGLAVIHDYEQLRDGVTTFSGHGIFSYDAETDRYTLYWLDSIGSPPETFTGTIKDSVLMLQSSNPRMQVRMTWDLSEPDRMVSSMEMSQDGNEWKRLFDAVYRRVR